MMRAVAALCLVLASPALAQEQEQAQWVALHDKVEGWLGTNPRNRDGLMIEVSFDIGGTHRFPVIWEADNAGVEVLKGCDFRLDARGSACHAQVVASVVKGKDIVVLVERLIALEK